MDIEEGRPTTSADTYDSDDDESGSFEVDSDTTRERFVVHRDFGNLEQLTPTRGRRTPRARSAPPLRRPPVKTRTVQTQTSRPKASQPDSAVPFDRVGDMESIIDGVAWATGGENKRNFADAFTESLRTVDLPPAIKLMIRQRFLPLCAKYRIKKRKLTWYYWGAKMSITVGSILVPALITLNEYVGNDARAPGLYWSIFMLSLFVTTANAIQEVTGLGERYLATHTAEQLMIQEAWLFLELAGRYRRYENHRRAWKRFVTRVEIIHGRMGALRSARENRRSTRDATDRGGPIIEIHESYAHDRTKEMSEELIPESETSNPSDKARPKYRD